MKKLISFIIMFLITATIFTLFSPAEVASADSNRHEKDNKDIWCDWIKGWEDWDNWKDWENWWDDDNDTLDEATEYLVLVGQPNGSYIAYDDIAFVTGKNNVMVKAKPVATALGMTYKAYSDKKKKGLTLTLGQDKNVYSRNSKTYYFMDYNPATNHTSQIKSTAAYKQIVHQNYNAVHCASLSTLLNYQYYDTSCISDYTRLGYCGVIVYNRHSAITKLPAITNIANFSGYIAINDPGNPNNNQVNATVKPVILTDPSYSDIRYIEATYTILQSNNTQVLDLSEVLSIFQSYNLPYGGVYGSGYSDSAITLQGYDKNGSMVGEAKTAGGVFVFGFYNATKVMVIGNTKNLILDFTPVTPLLITANTKLSLNQIGWLYQYAGYARQYFVIADKMRFSTENVISPYTVFRKYLSINSYTNPDSAEAYQRVCAVLKSPYSELTSANSFISIQKTNKGINNSLVVFADPGTTTLPTDYETKLNSMITSIKNNGLNTYFPSTNWNRQLVIKKPDNMANTTYNHIILDDSLLNLDFYLDYYYTMHEMVHFYEATGPHYGFRFSAWTEGSATNLAKKTLDTISIAHKDDKGRDYIDLMYTTDFSFLTQNDKNNFEAYYLNAEGWNATLIGYHFTDFLQDLYGSDIVYKIMQKVSAANIPNGSSRTTTYDKQFIDCIKAATTQDIFKLFVDKHILKSWD